MKRIITLAIAAMAVLAMPSSALAGRSHLVKMYKVEQHVDLQGQDDTYTLTCPHTDLAVDGMWRVDDVEQDNEYEYDGPGGSWSSPSADPLDHADWDVLKSVRPVEVWSTGDSKYDFQFTPMSGGDVQMKLWIICIGRKAEKIGGHHVEWDITTPADAPWDDDVNTTGDGTTTTDSDACPTGAIVVQPSFRVNSGDADLVESRPLTSADRQWQWTWTNSMSLDADHHIRCLALKSSVFSGSGSSHAHRLIKQWATKTAPSDGKFKKSSVSEVQVVCGEHYKGVLGGWNYKSNHGDDGYWNPNDEFYFHFLGMDPRIKTRAFKFINRYEEPAGLGYAFQDKDPDGLYLVCIKDKTS